MAAACPAARAAAAAAGALTSRAAPPPVSRRRISPATSSSPRPKARVRAMESRGRVSPGASASNSSSTRSAQSAAQPATIRRSGSLSVCGEATPRFSQASPTSTLGSPVADHALALWPQLREDSAGPVSRNGALADVPRVEGADEHVHGNVQVKVVGKLSGGYPGIERLAQHSPSRFCEAFAKAVDQLWLPGLFGQEGAEQRH